MTLRITECGWMIFIIALRNQYTVIQEKNIVNTPAQVQYSIPHK